MGILMFLVCFFLLLLVGIQIVDWFVDAWLPEEEPDDDD